MRNRLWMLFHLGTVTVLALLTVANVATWLRPFATSGESSSSESVQTLSKASTGGADRSPAAVDSAFAANSKTALKTAQVGCEPNVRLRVFDSVRQIRLQFDSCREFSSKGDVVRNVDVTSALNTTNGFEATVFGTAGARLAQAETERAMAFEPAAGTFSAPTDAPAQGASLKAAASKKSSTRGLASTDPQLSKKARLADSQISTDYISLVPGVNQIKIVRAGREQMLSIERK